MKKNISLLVGLVMILFAQAGLASEGGRPGLRQGTGNLKTQVLEQIKALANYSCSTLLDRKGESKCDYNITLGKWSPYEPAWHTGQIINALVKTYQLTGDKKYLAYAKKAGDWWCSLQIHDNPRLKGLVMAVHGAYVGDYIIFSTISDGTPGLFRLYNVTHEKKYGQIPTDAGVWLLKNMYLPKQGMFYDAINAKTGEVMKKSSPFWPGKEKQTLDNVARPNNEGSLFLDMYRYTGEEKYRNVFLDICNSLVEKEGPQGLWMQFSPNNLADSSFHPRFNLWYAESLLNGYGLTHDRKYLDAAKKTLLMYQKAQQKDGTIYYKNYLNGTFDNNSIAGSAVAFAGLLWIRMVKYGAGDEFKPNIEKSYRWISRNHFAYHNPDKNLRGAVIDLEMKNTHGKLSIIQRDLGTTFALRFLIDYYEYKFK